MTSASKSPAMSEMDHAYEMGFRHGAASERKEDEFRATRSMERTQMIQRLRAENLCLWIGVCFLLVLLCVMGIYIVGQ